MSSSPVLSPLTERPHLGSARLAVGWQALGVCSPLPQCGDDRHPSLCLALHMGAGGLNSGPWTHSASVLLTDFSPRPLVLGVEQGTMMSYNLSIFGVQQS